MQVIGDFFRVVFASTFDTFSNGLGGRISGHLERTAGITSLIAESLDNRSVGFVLGKVSGQCYQHPFNGLASDSVDVWVTYAFWAHEFDVKSLFGALAQQQSHFGMVAAVINEICT